MEKGKGTGKGEGKEGKREETCGGKSKRQGRVEGAREKEDRGLSKGERGKGKGERRQKKG